MRRADRLFSILQILRKGSVVRAADLAERLEVSERTIYRDMRDLIGSGVAVDGEAGVGYLLRDGFELPPLMFSPDEIEALVVAARMLQCWAGADLARAVTSLLEKVGAVMPRERQGELARSRLFAPDFNVSDEIRQRLDQLRQAINGNRIIEIAYQREDGETSRRCVHPMGLFYWGRVWTVAGWCELRDDYRHFRVDRMQSFTTTGRSFTETPERNLDDYLRRIGAEAAAHQVDLSGCGRGRA